MAGDRLGAEYLRQLDLRRNPVLEPIVARVHSSPREDKEPDPLVDADPDHEPIGIILAGRMWGRRSRSWMSSSIVSGPSDASAGARAGKMVRWGRLADEFGPGRTQHPRQNARCSAMSRRNPLRREAFRDHEHLRTRSEPVISPTKASICSSAFRTDPSHMRCGGIK